LAYYKHFTSYSWHKKWYYSMIYAAKILEKFQLKRF
jgi:hypothetical protein